MKTKPRIKPISRRPHFKQVAWECSAPDDKATFRLTGRGITPQSAYAHWLHSNEIPF